MPTLPRARLCLISSSSSPRRGALLQRKILRSETLELIWDKTVLASTTFYEGYLTGLLYLCSTFRRPARVIRERGTRHRIYTLVNLTLNLTRLCTVKTSSVLGNAIPAFGRETETGVFVVWLFFRLGLCSAISFKRSRLGLFTKVAEHRSFWKNKGLISILAIFQGSAISFKRSQRELLIDEAEHRSMLKNNQNTLYPRLSFIPKAGIAFPKTGFLFLLWAQESKLLSKFLTLSQFYTILTIRNILVG